jgi:periplasmic protein TonB
MYPHLHPEKNAALAFALSVALHALMIAAAVLLIKPDRAPLPVSIPVNIVNLPQELAKKLPPLQKPVPPPPVVRPMLPRPAPPLPATPRPLTPEKPLPPGSVPRPKTFGADDTVRLPKTTTRTGVPEGAEQGKETGKATAPPGMHSRSDRNAGPLPFLSQNDIDELARKGMPERSAGDDSVTLDTDEFKFISYNRWLKIKVESVLKYPELAAVSGYQGTLFIRFDIMKDGSLGELEVLKSSGYKILDDEALRSIRASAPFQPLPDDWHMDRYSIRAAVIFFLGQGYIR